MVVYLKENKCIFHYNQTPCPYPTWSLPAQMALVFVTFTLNWMIFKTCLVTLPELASLSPRGLTFFVVAEKHRNLRATGIICCGSQMVCFQTKNSNLRKFWRDLQ
jgi:hypothetical protein